MAKKAKAELVYLTPVDCGESPVWDEDNQKLYWMDLVSAKIFLFNPENRTNKSFPLEGMLGALTLCEEGGVILVAENGFYFFDPEKFVFKHIIDPEFLFPDHYFGDGKCDPQGRFWAGTYHKDISQAKGSLYSLENDLSVKVRHKNIILSNGLGWSLDQKTFYHVDSVAKNIYSFDFCPVSGDLSNQRLIRKIEEKNYLPDGITIDTEGHLWVAVYNSGKILRIHPQTGKTVFEIFVPFARQVTSCTFGGKDYDELYITTAREIGGPYGMLEDELDSQKNAGGLFMVKLPFQGIPPMKFKGYLKRLAKL